MLQLPTVLGHRRESATLAEFDLRVPATLDYFSGHFPDFPVLPGVVQLGWAIHWARQEFGMSGRAPEVSLLKFMRPVRPETELCLRLTQNDGSIAFSFSNAQHDYSSGRLSFPARVHAR